MKIYENGQFVEVNSLSHLADENGFVSGWWSGGAHFGAPLAEVEEAVRERNAEGLAPEVSNEQVNLYGAVVIE